ncbi:hypothetical protein H5A20_00930 [Pectobacterium brasiliense]|uniref:hypothetical protein n=1 Tax=Pectobacterium brasiliense TaxID=180957 RepID=UPI001968E9FD|nr:hypothetical protein [Pectobacterium brasiliense]MBN3197269.1 hypothetical protein [Pectobacterium brasiliense]
MLNNISTTSRFERKIDLLDKRLSLLLSKRLKRLENEGINSILEQSHKLIGTTEPQLWVAKISSSYRLIFRNVEKNRIELIDIVTRDDLSKFAKEMK